MTQYLDREIIIGGDFNTYLNDKLDKKGKVHNKNYEYTADIHNLMENCNLIDIWRVLNPDTKRFTWRGMTRSGQVHSRLDYFLISKHMIYDIHKCKIQPSLKSDHSILTVTFKFNYTVPRGRGFWKFNSSLLKDSKYVDLVNQQIEKSKIQYQNLENKSLLWDIIKCDIRGITISYSSHKAKEMRKKENNLQERLRDLEELLDESHEITLENEYNNIKTELENIHENKAKGQLIRSKARWVEDGEKCTKYFMQLENNNYKTKFIKSVVVDDIVIKDPQQILNEEKKFYENLYKSNDRLSCEENCDLFTKQSNKLNEEEKKRCDTQISLKECSESLKNMSNNKTPGSDGFNTEFYKFFWPSIRYLVYESYLYGFEKGELSIDQRRAVINLLPKPDKDLRYLKNWRPISLLNTDYKILTKALAVRLQSVMPSVISEDQTGYLKGRYIGENVRTIIDILEHTALKHNAGLMIFLDFEKAFDSVSWSFLIKTLEYFGFGQNFIQWIKIIYNNISSCVLNNGKSTEFFKIHRGIRQGCPISALLFILVAEIMAINLKANTSIKGIQCKNTKILLTQFADDTTIFLKDKESLENSIHLLKHFYQCSGLKLNRSKTEAFRLGASNNISIANTGIKTVEKTKSLGIILTKNTNDLIQLNFEERVKKIKNVINMWKGRNLTIKGKITLLRNKVMPLILYASSMLYTPPETIQQIERLMYDFIWTNGKHHVPKNVIVQSISNGGLNMPDLQSMINAIKLTWVKRILNKDDDSVEAFACTDFKRILSHNVDSTFLVVQPKPFYKQILNVHNTFKNMCSNANEILNEKILMNKHILIEGQTVKFKNLDSSTVLNDLLNNKYTLKKREDLIRDNIVLSQLEYNSLISAVPREWLNKLKNYTGLFEKIPDYSVKIDSKHRDLKSVKCKEFYHTFVKQKYTRAKSLYKWEELYYFADFDWQELFLIPYRYCRETSIQSLQFQIINRYFPSNSILNTWHNTNETCNKCGGIDTIEHYFYHCDPIKKLWTDFMKWYKEVHNVTFTLGCLDVVFGIVNTNQNPVLTSLNYCILSGKAFIRKQNMQNANIALNAFLAELKRRLVIEKYITTQKGTLDKFNQDFGQLLQKLQTVSETY